MQIALIGYGRMGHLVRTFAEERGHEVPVIIGEAHENLSAEMLPETLRMADVAIDFSVADAVRRNVEACMLSGIPIVEGTTGWSDQRSEVEKLVADAGGAIVFGANFSIGVNLFYKIAEYAGELFSKFPEYEAFIEEQHHSGKKDSPSGTALRLKDVVEKHIKIGDIASTRAGKIPGTHRLGFDSAGDQILLEHTARSRDGFALGAVTAAEWIIGRKGFYEFTDMFADRL